MEYIEEQVVVHKRFYVDPKNVKRVLNNPRLLKEGKAYLYSELTKAETMYIHGTESMDKHEIPNDITLREILDSILDFYNVTESQILSSTRKKEIVHVRAVYSFIAKELKFNEEDIQALLSTSRCSVYHHYKKYSGFIKYDRKLKNELEEVMKNLKKCNQSLNVSVGKSL